MPTAAVSRLGATATQVVADAGARTRDVSDAWATRIAYLVVVAMVAVGVALTLFTVRYWRTTRPEPRALGRLEVMGMRRWARADYADQRSLLDDVFAFVGGDGPVVERVPGTEPVGVPEPRELEPATGEWVLVPGAGGDGGGEAAEPAGPSEPTIQFAAAEVATLAELVEATPREESPELDLSALRTLLVPVQPRLDVPDAPELATSSEATSDGDRDAGHEQSDAP